MAMTRSARWGLIVGVPVLIVVAVILFWQWDWFIPIVDSQASAAIGRKVTVQHLHVALGRVTHIVADDVQIDNPDGFAEGDPFVHVAHLGLDFDVENYIRNRTVVISAIDLDQPKIAAVALADGSNNYTLKLKPSPPADPKAPPSPPPALGRLTIEDGTAHVVIPKLRTDATATIASRDGPDGGKDGGQIVVEAKGTYAGQPVTGKLVGGALLNLRDSAKPYPIDLQLADGPTQVAAQGTVQNPLAFAGADVKLVLSGPDMALLFPLVGIALPKTPPYKIAGNLDYEAGKIRFRDFAGTLGQSDIGGTVSVDPGPARPDVTADLHSKNVDLEDLGGLLGSTPGRTSDPNMTAAQRAELARAKASPQLVPNTPINLPRLRAADLHIKYRGDHIKGRNVPFDTIAVTADVVDGAIDLHPLSLGVGTGHIVAQVKLDPKGEHDFHTTAEVQVQRLDVSRMLAATHAVNGAGRLGGSASIDTQGSSLAGMLAAGNGKLDLFMSGGNLSALMVDLSGLEFGNALLSALGIPNRATLECLIGRFALHHGVLQTQTMLIDTSEAVISGRGNIDLGHERLEYSIKTEAKHFTIGSLPAPIGITGTFKKPSIGPDLATLGVRGGAAVGLGVLFPPLALLPTIQLGVGNDARCSGLLAKK